MTIAGEGSKPTGNDHTRQRGAYSPNRQVWYTVLMVSAAQIIALIPAYNCEASITSVVERTLAQGLEVLVVDDGSGDGTVAAAREAGAEVLEHLHNRGKGHALWTGFARAMERGASHVVTLDGDAQHDPAELGALLRHLPDGDLVVGRRRLDPRQMPATRLFGNLVSSFWISIFCGRLLPDTQSGYRVYSRRLLEKIPQNGGRFETETEILVRACRLGAEVRWVPIATIYETGLAPHKTNFITFPDTLRVMDVVLRSPWYPKRAK